MIYPCFYFLWGWGEDVLCLLFYDLFVSGFGRFRVMCCPGATCPFLFFLIFIVFVVFCLLLVLIWPWAVLVWEGIG